MDRYWPVEVRYRLLTECLLCYVIHEHKLSSKEAECVVVLLLLVQRNKLWQLHYTSREFALKFVHEKIWIWVLFNFIGFHVYVHLGIDLFQSSQLEQTWYMNQPDPCNSLTAPLGKYLSAYYYRMYGIKMSLAWYTLEWITPQVELLPRLCFTVRNPFTMGLMIRLEKTFNCLTHP